MNKKILKGNNLNENNLQFSFKCENCKNKFIGIMGSRCPKCNSSDVRVISNTINFSKLFKSILNIFPIKII